jgi:hypothetical protein
MTAGAEPPERRTGTGGSRRKLLGAAASTLVLAALGYTLVDGWATVVDYEWQLRAGWLVAAAVLLAIAYGLAGEAYARVAGELHPPATAQRGPLRRVWAVSLLGRYVPGNVLMVAGRLELGRAAGVPRKISLAASTYEQILMLSASALGGLAFLVFYGDLELGAALWLVGTIPLLAAILHPALLRRISGWALERAGREPLAALLSVAQATGAFALYAIVQGAVGIAAWMLARGTAGPEAGDLGFVTLAFELAFAVAMLAFIFPSGLGVRDGVFAVALAQNLPDEVAVAVAVLVRLALTMFELAFIGAVALIVRRSQRTPGRPLS